MTLPLISRLTPHQKRFLTKRLFRYGDTYQQAATALSVYRYPATVLISEVCAYRAAIQAKRNAISAQCKRAAERLAAAGIRLPGDPRPDETEGLSLAAIKEIYYLRGFRDAAKTLSNHA